MQSGSELATTLLRKIINDEVYLGEEVRTGTCKSSRDPRNKAKYLMITGGINFLLYLLEKQNSNRPACRYTRLCARNANALNKNLLRRIDVGQHHVR